MNSKARVLIFLLCITGIGVFLRGHVSEYLLQFQDKKPCACDTCLVEDEWLLQRANKSAESFLSAKHNLSEDAFNWWKHLQAERRNYSFYKQTVDKLFQTFPSSPDFIERSPDRCRTCAVVGNSGNLNGSHYGRLIDFHDVIIRMNTGRTKGYEADVGSRTTHHVMYPESAMDLDTTTHLVLFPFKIQDLEWLMKATTTGFSGTSYVPVKSKIKANKDLVMVVNPAFMRYVHDIWLEKKGRYPSTGFMVLVLALHICDEVNVFGFGADRDGNWNHYFEILKNKKLRTGPHAGMHEHEVILKLKEQQKIGVFKGW
ncbi:CMP-N-acetylneuraminate-beta-galactosamide-alpha-2,3-sialyltransferase 1-like [Morone saxatilis]|uniref:CMP-N-acetylneuraminate-beta-galactosamide- alpha-2,3-sialyltransferase 1-like n=1 Tax=Morone saxatilis TaxID=34816 RepID=UPI0015E233E8|nr:CMP-N-acetylneuraminate-beta-galactosamide-alpha-2,3-sialyltransferase 1-like [Morone saxatilis]